MRTILFIYILVCLTEQLAHSQTSYPNVPEQDYSIYTTIINEFSNCSDQQYAYRQNQLLFISSTTEVQSRYGFRFDFTKAQQELDYLLSPKALIYREPDFYKEPDWQHFLTSVDSSSFDRYTFSHTIPAQCQQTKIWTDEQQEYYLGKETHLSRGFYALRNDFDNFGGLVRFSKVAYSIDHNKAICYYSAVSDGKAGAGYLLFLGKSRSNWRIIGKAMLWIA